MRREPRRRRLRASERVTAAMNYRPEIDGLRAVAVLPVILFHGGFTLFGGGFVGVDVFFVISGYLISTIIMTELDEGRFTLAGFYERRARRILPALFLVMAACLPFAWAWMVPTRLEDFGQSLTAVAAFASNMLFWQESGYFSAAAEQKPLLHTWSLAIEEQFYVLFPALMLFAWRFGARIVAGLVLLAALASLGFSEWLAERDPAGNFFLAPPRAWELMLGVLAALWLRHRPEPVPRALGHAGGLAGLAMILLAVFWFDGFMPFPSLYALLPTVGTAMVIVFAQTGTAAARLLSLRWVVGLGLISYSAYLWHQPMFAFARVKGINESSQWLFGLLALAALALAWLSWRFVERPFRDRRRFARRQIFRAAVAGSVLFAVLGTSVDLARGFRDRYSDAANALAARPQYSPERGACHASDTRPITPEEACRYFGAKITTAVIGDSHAVEMAHALAMELEPRGEGILHLSYSDALPALLMPEYPKKQKFFTDALDYLIAHEEIRDVVVIFMHANALMGSGDLNFPDLPDEPLMPRIRGTAQEKRERYWESFSHLVDQLLRHGKRVVVTRPIPELGRQISEIIYARDRQGSGDFTTLSGVSRTWYDARNRFFNQRLDAFPGDGNLLRFAPADLLCDTEFCYAVRDGEPLYFDSHHVSLTGAALLARGIVEMLDRQAGR